MFDWLRKLLRREKKLCNDNDFSLKWKRFDQQVREAREEERAQIAEKNAKRQKSALGYGLKSRNFRPRPHQEKQLWRLDKKPPKKLADED